MVEVVKAVVIEVERLWKNLQSERDKATKFCQAAQPNEVRTEICGCGFRRAYIEYGESAEMNTSQRGLSDQYAMLSLTLACENST